MTNSNYSQLSDYFESVGLNKKLIEGFYDSFSKIYQERLDRIVDIIVKAKQENKKIAVVTGSGPNIHEGVTTLIAELINKDIVDGVLTSSAVIAHEMAGALDKVKRVNIKEENLVLPLDKGITRLDLPKGDIFELTELSKDDWDLIKNEMHINEELVDILTKANGKTIIKAAGNMAYPMGLRTEKLAEEILKLNKEKFNNKYSLEFLAGLGADKFTMIGAGAKKGVPVLVSIPQMIGGGAVGLSIGDSIPIHERCKRNANILKDADIIIESGLALAQEIHDGPFETYTGHGIWAQWQDIPTFSLKDKYLFRFDLDQNLEKVWQQQHNTGLVQQAIDDGKPKTKVTGVPFRMEMSGFARLELSIPIVGDIGEIWPVIALRVAEDLGIKLDFISYKQETEQGKKMREWIVNNVKFIDKLRLDKILNELSK
ncbi:MAG: hypothetical protein ACTSVC_06095 [Promethearchaeota archaeon]